MRPFKFAIHLQKYGYKPVILTIGNSGSIKTEKENELLKGITVIEIESPVDRTETADSDEHSSAKKKRFPRSVMDWIDKQTPLDTWIYLFKARYKSIYSRVKSINPDIIWATGDPWSGLWLGEKLAKDFELPYVADFRDPWTLTRIGLRERSEFSSDWDKEVEKRIITYADRIVFTSKHTKDNYCQYYPDLSTKSYTIYNSYDKTLAGKKIDDNWNVNFDQKKLNIIFFGRFRRLSPVKPVSDALIRIREQDPDILNHILIHSFGKPDPECMKDIQSGSLRNNFTFHEPVVPEEMTPVLDRADILLLSTSAERDDIIPAKLWDYLSVEKPIFSILSNPEVGDIIMRSKAGIQVHPEETPEIADIIISYAHAKKSNDKALLAVEKDIPDRLVYDSERTTSQLAAIFDDLTTNA